MIENLPDRARLRPPFVLSHFYRKQPAAGPRGVFTFPCYIQHMRPLLYVQGGGRSRNNSIGEITTVLRDVGPRDLAVSLFDIFKLQQFTCVANKQHQCDS